LQKVTVSFIVPSVRMEQLGPHCMDFHEISYLNIFQKNMLRQFKFIKIWQK